MQLTNADRRVLLDSFRALAADRTGEPPDLIVWATTWSASLVPTFGFELSLTRDVFVLCEALRRADDEAAARLARGGLAYLYRNNHIDPLPLGPLGLIDDAFVAGYAAHAVREKTGGAVCYCPPRLGPGEPSRAEAMFLELLDRPDDQDDVLPELAMVALGKLGNLLESGLVRRLRMNVRFLAHVLGALQRKALFLRLPRLQPLKIEAGESQHGQFVAKPAATGNLKECRTCLERMRAGIGLLKSDPLLRDAFLLANRAILMQQHHSRLPRRGVDDAWDDFPASYEPGDPRAGRWRAFQLAFILMNLRSLVRGPGGKEPCSRGAGASSPGREAARRSATRTGPCCNTSTASGSSGTRLPWSRPTSPSTCGPSPAGTKSPKSCAASSGHPSS
ncbi:MAG: hypothetical protein K2P78_12840 [Gemmataceae bacterium]|nr:hypothetical protein [Gemmataceae bacterium]